MKNVLLISPGNGNGGIRSWTIKFLDTFPDGVFNLVFEGSFSYRSSKHFENTFYRLIDGTRDLASLFFRVRKRLLKHDILIMHTTTSGSFGTLRDFVLMRLCHLYNVKCIMHCRYGCIKEDYERKSFWGYLLRKTMKEYDQIWVLDSHSADFLKGIDVLTDKVFVTPNSIEVSPRSVIEPKTYKSVAFIGNLVPTKGLFELVDAARKLNDSVKLTIAGPGSDDVVQKIKDLSGNLYGDSIIYLGRLNNKDVLSLMEEIDILALPTYYPSEGFPISILEAMSKGKMVISCDRAAILDMLTAVDGSPCGMIVKEKSVDAIVEAIQWCQDNKTDADEMCKKAYDKAINCYDTKVVYNLYRSLYNKVLQSN